MPDEVDHNLRRKTWIGIMIFLSLFWGGVIYLIAHYLF